MRRRSKETARKLKLGIESASEVEKGTVVKYWTSRYYSYYDHRQSHVAIFNGEEWEMHNDTIPHKVFLEMLAEPDVDQAHVCTPTHQIK